MPRSLLPHPSELIRTLPGAGDVFLGATIGDPVEGDQPSPTATLEHIHKVFLVCLLPTQREEAVQDRPGGQRRHHAGTDPLLQDRENIVQEALLLRARFGLPRSKS